MTLEMLPLVLGGLLGLVGLGLLLDAWVADSPGTGEERRARPRSERDRRGEALIGLGVLAMAAALFGRDQWRYSIVTVIVGMIAMLWGVKRNGGYLRGLFSRREPVETPVVEGSRRIR
jgi:hypothetical protein